MSQSEKSILNETLQLVSSLPDSLIWRNNTGQAWQGERVRAGVGQAFVMEHGMVVLRNARPIDFGLRGSGDAGGAIQGRPVMIETKNHHGHQTSEQVKFERAWTRCGGLYVLARSADEAMCSLLLNL